MVVNVPTQLLAENLSILVGKLVDVSVSKNAVQEVHSSTQQLAPVKFAKKDTVFQEHNGTKLHVDVTKYVLVNIASTPLYGIKANVAVFVFNITTAQITKSGTDKNVHVSAEKEKNVTLPDRNGTKILVDANVSQTQPVPS